MTTSSVALPLSELPTEPVEPIQETITAAAAGGYFPYMWLLIALPVFGAAVLLIGGRRTNSWGHILACLLPIGSFILACLLLSQMMGAPVDERLVTIDLWDWTFAGAFDVPFALRLDPLSMVFVMLITGVGSLIHIYSIGYMAEDPDRRKFFAYLNLFFTRQSSGSQ